MKKVLKKQLLILVVAFGAAYFAPVTLHAQEQIDHRGETEQEHQALVDIIESFAQYGDAFKGFTLYFFGAQTGCPQLTKSATPIKPSKAIFLDLAHKLLLQINAVEAKITQYQTSMQTEDSKKLIAQLKALAALLATSQKNLQSTLQKYLGTKHLLIGLNQLAKQEEKQVTQIRALQKTIDRLLVAHAEQKLKQHFDIFVKHLEEALTFPEKNWKQASATALKYVRLK